MELEWVGTHNLGIDFPYLKVFHKSIRHGLEVLISVSRHVRVLAFANGAGETLRGAETGNVGKLMPEVVCEARR